MRKKRAVFTVLFVLYLAVLLRITVFRGGWYRQPFFDGEVIWLPFQTIFGYLTSGQIGYFLYLFIGNLIWFVPFGFCFRLRGLAFWKVILLTAALSVLIEGLQFIFATGCTETEDVLLNTAGGAIGALIAGLFRKKKS